MIRSLQSLRGIFAILIFLTHYEVGEDVILPAGGDCGVAFFVILSGFVLSAGYSDTINSGKFRMKLFLQKRLRKIYPLHLFCFAWAVLLYHYFSPITASFNLLLLQSWVPRSDFFFSYNAVSWFLSDVLFFYLLFPTLVVKVVRTVSGISLFAILVLAYIAALTQIPHDYLNAICYINPAVRLLDFVIGMLLWKVCSSRPFVSLKDRLSGWRYGFAVCSFLELFVVTALITCIIEYKNIPECYGLAVYWWPVMVTIILVFTLTDIRTGLISKLLQTKLLMGFGSVSLGFYLVHVLTIHSMKALFEKLGCNFSVLAEFMLIFTIAAILGVLYNRFDGRMLSKQHGK